MAKSSASVHSSSTCGLLALGLIEKDTNGDVLWTWSYPSVTSEKRTLLLRKCGLDADASGSWPVPFRFCHHRRIWYYLMMTEVSDNDKLPRVRQFVLVIQAKDFHPEKYEALSRILSKRYGKTGDPGQMLQLYLSVIIKGSCSTEENGTFVMKEFDEKTAYMTAPVKELITMFGLEIILIYTALILKKRIVVYHHNLDVLMSILRAFPPLVWHRQCWDVLYPYVELNNVELEELESLVTYIAGFLDATVESRLDLYDIYVNLAATEITIAPHAKDVFAMTKLHKDIAMLMVRQAESEELTDQQVIKEIAGKTQELLNTLKSFSTSQKNNEPVITAEGLKEHKLPPALENFMWNLAVAERLVDI